MDMNIEVGRCYKTRDHRRVRILATNRKSPRNNRPIVGLVEFEREENVYMYSYEGRCCSNYVENAFDIVDLWKESTMSINRESIEAGKYYRTRDGEKVRITATDRKHPYYVVTGLFLQDDGTEELGTWTKEGNFSNNKNNAGKHHSDLVSLWYEPPVVNWAPLPVWAQYIAQNENGVWWWFPERPEILYDAWTRRNGGRIPEEYAPSYSGPWWESLVERPKVD